MRTTRTGKRTWDASQRSSACNRVSAFSLNSIRFPPPSPLKRKVVGLHRGRSWSRQSRPRAMAHFRRRRMYYLSGTGAKAKATLRALDVDLVGRFCQAVGRSVGWLVGWCTCCSRGAFKARDRYQSVQRARCRKKRRFSDGDDGVRVSPRGPPSEDSTTERNVWNGQKNGNRGRGERKDAKNIAQLSGNWLTRKIGSKRGFGIGITEPRGCFQMAFKHGAAARMK